MTLEQSRGVCFRIVGLIFFFGEPGEEEGEIDGDQRHAETNTNTII
jgi:hypothetical protein